MRAAILLVPVLVAGCITLETFESIPVEVQTPQGAVTCQLYGINQTTADRAISRPDTLTDAQADAACKQEGERLKAQAAG